MENASKALIMASGVLIALLVIGLLVMFFNNLSDLQRIEQSGEDVQKASEFNKPYDVYARNVYGSELFSLARMVEDYNKRESDNKGYTPIEVEINFTKNLDDSKSSYNTFFKKKLYTATEIEKEMKDLEKKIDEIGRQSVSFKKDGTDKTSFFKISQLANMRTKDIQELGTAQEEYETKKDEYVYYKTILSQVKQTVFKYDGFGYDDNTGRIKKMKYEL